MYVNGVDVLVDYVLAYVWLELGPNPGSESVANLHNALADKMTSAQTAEAAKLAREWKPKWGQRLGAG